MIADDPASWGKPADLEKPAPLVDEEAERKRAEQYEALQRLFRIDQGCADERVYGVPMNGYEAAARERTQLDRIEVSCTVGEIGPFEWGDAGIAGAADVFVIPGIEGDDDDATITWDAW